MLRLSLWQLWHKLGHSWSSDTVIAPLDSDVCQPVMRQGLFAPRSLTIGQVAGSLALTVSV